MAAFLNKGKTLLYAGVFLCLLQIWLPGFYLTGDGPCHLYNARIMHDIWSGQNVDLYRSFFEVGYQPHPNWLSTVLLAGLMFLVKAVVAEKLFLSIYVLVYISGFYLLLKKLSPGGYYWVLSVFLLVFPLTLAKGFYNFSFSIGFYFWIIYLWILLLEHISWQRVGGLLCLIATVFFTHLLAFVFAAFTCLALLFSWCIAFGQPRALLKKYSFSRLSLLFLLFAPFILLSFWFTGAQGGLQLQLTHHFYRMVELFQLKFLVTVTNREYLFLYVASGMMFLLFFYVMFQCKQWRRIQKFDGLLITLVLALVIYLFFPESFMGHLILISMRVQLYILVLILCCIAYLLPDNKLKNSVGILFFICFVGLTLTRIRIQLKASDGVTEVLSASGNIKPGSVLLPLDFEPQGKDTEGNIISDNYLFAHVAQYIGANIPLIILDNYEANMGYFPLHWIDKMNPYYNLSVDAGIEGHPPAADLAHYEAVSGRQPDYILMWCYNDSYLSDPGFSRLYHDIVAGYHQVYISPAKRAVLFEKNG